MIQINLLLIETHDTYRVSYETTMTATATDGKSNDKSKCKNVKTTTNQNIFQLDVPVHQALAVQVTNSLYYVDGNLQPVEIEVVTLW